MALQGHAPIVPTQHHQLVQAQALHATAAAAAAVCSSSSSSSEESECSKDSISNCDSNSN